MNRILFVYHASNIGGGTYCLLNILKSIDRTKYLPIVLLCSSGDLVREIEKLDIKVYYFPQLTLYPYNQSVLSRGYFRTLVRQFLSMRRFKQCVQCLEVDAVYINTMMLAPYLKVAKKLGLRTCIHIREHWPMDAHKLQLKYLRNSINKYADKVVAINSYSASIVPEKDVAIVYDWIDMSNRYKEMPLDTIFAEDISKYKIYLFTGGIQLVKGTYELVKIFREQIAGNDKRLLMVGVSAPSTDGLVGKIKFFLSRIGINSYEYKCIKEIKKDTRIKCIPPVYELAHLMRQSYCNLSFFTIPHANLALAESIIEGCIPVAATTSESVEYSRNGELAVLYELGNANDLLEKLGYLDTHYSEIKDRIAKYKGDVESMFSPASNTKRLNIVYDELFK